MRTSSWIVCPALRCVTCVVLSAAVYLHSILTPCLCPPSLSFHGLPNVFVSVLCLPSDCFLPWLLFAVYGKAWTQRDVCVHHLWKKGSGQRIGFDMTLKQIPGPQYCSFSVLLSYSKADKSDNFLLTFWIYKWPELQSLQTYFSLILNHLSELLHACCKCIFCPLLTQLLLCQCVTMFIKDIHL